jgi:CRP/FNR family transcriptional regulator, cyclic AMP receptor protein
VLRKSIVTAERAADPKALARLKTLAWLTPAQLERLAANAESIRVPRHGTIFYEGETSSRVYVLLSGVAKLSFLNGSERVLVSLVGPGEVFGVSSLLPQATRPFRCDAFSDCTVAVIRPEVFVDTVLGVPLDTLSRTLEVTVGRWWSMLLRYATFVGLGLRERLAGALLELASKFGARDSRGTLLTLKLTHEDLAELVGASRQRTTEQLSEFERERAIVRDGRRLIIVPEKLWALVQPPAPAHRKGSASDGSGQVHHGKRP